MIYLFKLFFEEEKRRRVILNLFVVCLMLSISSIVFAGGLTFSGQVKDKAGTLIGAGKAVDLKSTADNSVKTSTVTDASSYILNSLGWFWGESNYSVKVYVDNGDYYGHSRTLYLGDTTAKPGDAPVNINTSFKKAVPPTPILDSAYVAVEKVLNEIPTSNEAPVIKFHVNAKSGSGYKGFPLSRKLRMSGFDMNMLNRSHYLQGVPSTNSRGMGILPMRHNPARHGQKTSATAHRKMGKTSVWCRSTTETK